MSKLIGNIQGRPFRWCYYDVWGNKKDGYEVNSVFRSNEVIMIPEGLGIRTLTKHLRKIGFFKKGLRGSDIEYDGDEDTIYISYKGKPEGELRAE